MKSINTAAVFLCVLIPCTFSDAMVLQTETYSTNFSTIDSLWQLDQSCFDCEAKNPDECTKNFASAVRPGSIANKTGLTITTTQQDKSNFSWCSPTAGGSSGKLKFSRALSFGTIRVKSRYFPGSESMVKSAKGFVGLESPASGAITITIHGAGASASGAPSDADWTRYIQSSCYQHGNDHNKQFSKLDSSVNLATDYNWFEVDWTSKSVTIKVNGKVVRTVTDASKVPQKPLYVQLHSRSIGYSQMPTGGTFESYIQEFHFQPAAATSTIV